MTSYDAINAFTTDIRALRAATAAQGSVEAATAAAYLRAEEAAQEFGLATPDTLTQEALEFLAAQRAITASAQDREPTAVVMSPSFNVLGLALFRGFQTAGQTGHITFIDPEAEHQQLARQALSEAAIPANAYRFIPSIPLNVISRLTKDHYDVLVAECDPEDMVSTAQATLPVLRTGGILVLLDSLMDGLIADESRTERDIATTRQAARELAGLEGMLITRLPLGAGLTAITKL